MKKLKKKKEQQQYQEQTQELCIHFDTKEHRIGLDEFVLTVSSYETIANNIAESIFDVKKGVKIYILPSKAGSFDLSMLLWLSGAAVAGVIGGIASDSVKGFVKGVTKRLAPDKYPNGFDFGKSAELFADTMTGFMLETAHEVDRLDNLIPNGKNIDASKKAKSNIYNMCSRNKDILGVSFTHEHKFELKRADFVERGIPPAIKPLPVKVELKELIIVKPVNVEEDLQWDLKDKNTKEPLTAKMLDEDFKAMLFEGKCPQRKHTTPDVITAMVEFHDNLKDGKESKSEYLITEVYKFNRKKLKPIPDGYKLNRRKKIDDSNNGQLNLFRDQKRNK